MKEEHFKWYSPTLSKDFEMLVFGHAGYPIVIFPSTKGRYHESKDFLLMESARPFIEQGKFKMYCVDSIDTWSWYNRSVHPADRVRNHMWFDKMLREEIVEKIRHESPLGKVGVAGPSFGGYQAANFAFRHPGLVSHLIGMSAAFDIRDQLDGYYDENVYFNNPVDFVPHMTDENLWKMSIVLGTCEHDICKEANYNMSKILNDKGVRHWLDDRPGYVHDWVVWRDMFPHYLSEFKY